MSALVLWWNSQSIEKAIKAKKNGEKESER